MTEKLEIYQNKNRVIELKANTDIETIWASQKRVVGYLWSQ